MLDWSLSPQPIVGAPMAGTGTPALAAAISNAGGFGLFPGGYLSGDKLTEGIARVWELTDRPFGVNLFVPTPVDEQRDAGLLRSYAEALAPVAQSAGVQLPEPRWDGSDDFAEKVAVLEQARVALVSFIFGPPPVDAVQRLHAAGSTILATVTDAAEAQAAAAAGADLLCLQGTDAGGHRGTHRHDAEPNTSGWRELLPAVLAVTDLPVVVAGGIMAAGDVSDALARGAVAVQCGSAFLLTDECGMTDAYRAGFTAPELTEQVVTRAFSGRPARAVRNEFVARFDPVAVPVYPIVNQLTKPVRAAGAATGNRELVSLWAGTGWRQARPGPAADVVAALAADLH
ncbi:nitronate monooxygenase [Flexivirga oryzae]|uniref:Propionate 3-nitronate monooxygenase n=1 Tax=Flexivirga oryzae TaxID=1794944 RepID=A0A839N7C1_9MICO|nr:nitronate monooxygenase [Flexivirga oryzae]MBB2891115.1 nitronate monooxygenase [Flexivirga oryzae]